MRSPVQAKVEGIALIQVFSAGFRFSSEGPALVHFASMSSGLCYLTVQDMLWINLQVTGKVKDYQFMKLEEGTFYQYGYGSSTDLRIQSERFLRGFTKNAPFTEGNEMTAVIGYLAFLKVNGHEIKLPNLADLLAEAKASGSLPAPTPIEHWHETTHPVTRAAIEEVLGELALVAR